MARTLGLAKRAVLFIVLVLSAIFPRVDARDNEPTSAVLEKAVAEKPTVPAPWVRLAEFHDKRDEHAAALLCYMRALTLASPPVDAKQVAMRVWTLLVPEETQAPSQITIRPPVGRKDPWFATDLALQIARAARHRGEDSARPDTEYFPMALKTLITFVEDERSNKKLSALWRKIVIPYFVEARERGYAQGIAHDIMRMLDHPEAHAWIEAHAELMAGYREWSRQWKPGA